MSPPDDDDDDDKVPSLSEDDIAGIERAVESAPPTQAAASTSRRGSVSALLHIGQDTTVDILKELDNMTVPDPIVVRMEPLFEKIGFALAKMSVEDEYDQTKRRPYTAATKNGFELPLLHLPNWFLQTTDSIGFLKQAIEKIRDQHGRIISEGLPNAANGYRRALAAMSEREANLWMFVPWGDIEEAFNGKTAIETVFVIPQSALRGTVHEPPAAAPPLKLQLDKADLDAIVNIFVIEAGIDQNFFKALVQNSDWPEPPKAQVRAGFTGNATNDGWYLLNFLVARNRYDIAHPHRGDTYLGWLLLSLLNSVGNPSDETLARIIIKYGLVTSPADLQRARDKLPGGS
jgi:hypothetical protein